MELDGCASLVKRLAVIGEKHGEDVAAFFQADALGRIDDHFGALRVDAFGATVLQGGEPGAVLRGVCIGAISVEGLANHQNSLAMRAVVARLVWKVDVGSQRQIAGELLPDKVESVGGGP